MSHHNSTTRGERHTYFLHRRARREEDLAELRAELRHRAQDVAEALLGAPNAALSTRDELRFGSRGSLALALCGEKRGLWFDFGGYEGKDLLALIMRERGGSFPDAVRWARDFLRMPETPPQARRNTTAAIPRAPAKSTSGMGMALWNESIPPAGTLVEIYLAARRLALPSGAPIRFHPSCPCGTERWPAMVALMTDPETGEPSGGIHRTFLARDGSGKAPIAPAKRMLGAAGVIRLVPDENVTLGLGISEGIETALSVMQHHNWNPVWAAGSAGAIRKFPVLAGIEALTIFADADDGGTSVESSPT